jgi:hypothetical protein
MRNGWRILLLAKPGVPRGKQRTCEYSQTAKRDTVKPPLHQRASKIVLYILGGFLGLGALLDSVANAISLLTPLVASIGTACIVLVWFLAYIILPSHPIPWVFGNQRMRVKKPGMQPTAFAVGMVILLWTPSIVTQWRPPPPPAEDKINTIQEFKRQQQPPIPQTLPLAKELPDVALRFVYPKSPALVLVNQSAVIARDIKWTVLLWNMDLTDRSDPLPIPVGKFDWIRPHDQGGPQNLFGSQHVAPLLKPGNRLFGSASVDCPECARGRTYIVYIVWDESGWFSEVENGKPGKPLLPLNALKDSRIKYFKALEAMAPAQSRTSIGER